MAWLLGRYSGAYASNQYRALQQFCAGAGGPENASVRRQPGWDYRLMNATGTRGAMDAGRARDSLNGLALGDAFGETWFRISAGEAERRQLTRDVPAGPWPWTDDTAMALSLYQVLTTQGEVRQDDLAHAFADAYSADPYRGYGGSMHDVLRCISAGEDWRAVTARQFGGTGSWGNRAAMRVAPLGAWLAVDLDQVAGQAALSAATGSARRLPSGSSNGLVFLTVHLCWRLGVLTCKIALAGGTFCGR